MGLLRTILIILTFYYAFKLISRYALPLFLKRYINKFQDRARQQYQNEQQPNVKVGETVIDKKPTNTKQTNNNVGEYVDYEEVE